MDVIEDTEGPDALGERRLWIFEGGVLKGVMEKGVVLRVLCGSAFTGSSLEEERWSLLLDDTALSSSVSARISPGVSDKQAQKHHSSDNSNVDLRSLPTQLSHSLFFFLLL